MDKSYWNYSGKYEALVGPLGKLIPDSGSVTLPRSKNKCLEKLRKANNCYYDFYNNGFCNRRQEAVRVFGLSRYDADTASRLACGISRFGDTSVNQLEETIEAAMDSIILAAAKEQGI